MILNLFLVFIGIALVLIALGLFRPEHSELAIIGFFFLFLLSFNVINGTLEYPIWTNTTNYYHYNETGNPSNPDVITSIHSEEVPVYATYQDHYYGVYLAIVSALGLAGVLIGLKKTNWREN